MKIYKIIQVDGGVTVGDYYIIQRFFHGFLGLGRKWKTCVQETPWGDVELQWRDISEARHFVIDSLKDEHKGNYSMIEEPFKLTDI